VGHGRAIGVALRTLGLLEGGVVGLGYLQDAVKILQTSPAPLEHARALVDLGAAMRRNGERAAARAPLRQGLDGALASGASVLAERAATELAATGARPRRLRASGVDALPPSELRVARLAAQGRTNNEVAQALFVTPKTVDTHLCRVYAKLGISSRHDLTGALEAPPLP
jgi:DNA-binding CsgD family transcriptional regulator